MEPERDKRKEIFENRKRKDGAGEMNRETRPFGNHLWYSIQGFFMKHR